MVSQRFIFFYIFFLIALPCSFGEENYPDLPLTEDEKKDLPPFEEEAPEAIFSTKLGDTDVSLFIEGSWEISLTGSLGWDLGSGSLIDTPFEEMTPGFAFSQIPDLTISLWLLDRYFFEVSVKEDSQYNTFLLGYEGKEDEVVQSVLLGNARIDIDDYAFLSVSSIPENSLGLSVALKSPISFHEVIVRYDPSELMKKEFIGNNLVNREIFQPYEYYRGRLFILPDNNIDPGTIQIYIEDNNGTFTGSDKRRYKIAENTEVFSSAKEGTVTFKIDIDSRVLVYYKKNGKEVGSTGLGIGALVGVDSAGNPNPALPPETFDWDSIAAISTKYPFLERPISINGKSALLIYDKNEYTPFESLSFYKPITLLPEDRAKINFGLSAKSNDPDDIDTTLKFSVEKELNLINIYVNFEGARDFYNRYPLTTYFSTAAGDPSAYGPGKNIIPGAWKKELRLESLTSSGGFQLDPDIVPGSVTVKRNGFVESMYDIDYQNGIITFKNYIHPADKITITYKTSYVDTEGGDILFATGNRFFIGDYIAIDLAAGVKWNVLPNQYSRYEGQYKGSILVTAGVDFEKENIRANLDAGLSLTSPDTTGLLRIFDMQQGGFTIQLGSSYIFPASASDDPINGFQLERSNRGKLIFKDFYSYSGGVENASLNNYTWNVPEDQIYEYRTGNPPGPYTAGAYSDGIEDEVLVMDMEVPDDSWVGTQIPIRKFSSDQDLSGAESFSFKIKTINASTGNLYIQIGSISEDLDGDGILDEEISAYSEGFAFNDIANNAVLRVGGIGGGYEVGNGSIESEDNNLNKVLDLEDPKNIITTTSLPLFSISSSGGWVKITHNFTEEEKRKLATSSAMRFIYINETGTEVTGRILIGELFIESSIFSATVATASDSEETYAKDVYERYGAGENPPPQNLVDAYPEVKEIFFNNFDISSTQKVLESEWDDIGYTLTGFSNPISWDTYDTLAGYIRIPELASTPSNFTISYTDTAGRGINASFKITNTFNDWRKFELDLVKNKIYLGGKEIPGTLYRSATDTGLSMFKITSDAASGKLYLDEIHFEDPVLSISGAVSALYEHTFPGTVLSVNGVDIFSDIYISEYVSYAHKDFSSDLSENSDKNNARSKTSFKIGILNSEFEANFDFNWSESEFYTYADHNFSSPLGTKFLMFTDYYSQSKEPDSFSFSKRNSFTANMDMAGSASISTESTLIYNNLSQNWDASYESPSDTFVTGGVDFSFSKTSSNYIPDESWYGEDWGKSFILWVPDDSDQFPDRIIVTDNNLSLNGKKIGVDFSIEAKTLSTGEEREREQESSGKITMEFPITAGTEGSAKWFITPGYSRNFSYTNKDIPGGGFLDDIALWGKDFAKQSPFYIGIPIAEFFMESMEETFENDSQYLKDAKYAPEIFIEISRDRILSWADFFLPVSFSIKYGKDFLKEDDTFTYSYRLTVDSTLRAVNMFGSLGLYPIFKFYKIDEFSTRVSYSASSTDGIGIEDQEVLLNTTFYFTGHKENELILDNKFRYIIDDSEDEFYIYNDLSASFTWFSRFKKRFYIKFISEKDDPDPYMAHTESFIFSTKPESSLTDKNYWTIFFTHESSLVFPERGHLKVLLSVGLERHDVFDYQNDKNGIFLLGIQAGLFGKVMF